MLIESLENDSFLYELLFKIIYEIKKLVFIYLLRDFEGFIHCKCLLLFFNK